MPKIQIKRGVVLVLIVAWCVLGLTVKGAILDELINQLKIIQQQVTSLQNRLAEIRQEASEFYYFSRNLKFGDYGIEVKKLQECLKMDKTIYPEGLVTGYFGNLTRQAVIRFQEKYAEEILTPWNIKHGTGFVGPTTRAKLNVFCNQKKELKLSSPEIIFPVNSESVSITPKLEWSKVKNANIYQWEIIGKLTGISKDNFVQIPSGKLDYNTSYFWRVRACEDIDLEGCGPWSKTGMFKTIFKSTSILNYPLTQLEREIHELVNQQRKLNNLPSLIWNDDIAKVARQHSQNLAQENKELTAPDICPIPIIHHQGLNSGLYCNDRLNNQGIFYFSSSAENIAILEVANRYYLGETSPCENHQIKRFQKMDLESILSKKTETEKVEFIKQQIDERKEFVKTQPKINWAEIKWIKPEEVKSKIISGWMESPGHRRNILNPGFNQAGVGIVKVNRFLIVTQVFITKVDCGYKYGPCCREKRYYPYCYLPLKCVSGRCVED